MTPEQIFALTGPPALLGWAILIFAPRRLAIGMALAQTVIPIGFSVLYAALVLRHFAETGGGFGTLQQVRQLFTSDWMLLAGWVHYLAFDLAIGAYLCRRMDRAGIGRIVQAPILVTTFLFGPIGFFLAVATQAVLTPRPLAASNPNT